MSGLAKRGRVGLQISTSLSLPPEADAPLGSAMASARVTTQPQLFHEGDLHWAAGLFEGEGTITIAVRKSDETYRLVVTMSNTDAEIVGFFQARWPCWVQPLYGDRPGRKPGSSWTAAGPRAEVFVKRILPYLRSARVRQKALLALEFRELQSRGGKGPQKSLQRELYLAMKLLNVRGRS